MKEIGVFVNTYLRLSESFIYEMIRSIKGYHVHVLSRDTQNINVFPWDNIHAVAANGRWRSFLSKFVFTLFRVMPSLVKDAKNSNITLIHAHFGIDAIYALVLCRKLSVPLVVTFHGHDITRLPKLTVYPISWFLYWLKFDELRSADACFLAVSDFVRKELLLKGFPEDKTFTHYLGIDVQNPCTYDRSEPLILFAGRLVEKKGVRYLIDAFMLVQHAIPNARLVICGDGPERQQLQSRVLSKGLNNCVQFSGWQSKSQVFERIKDAKVLVLPSVTAGDGDCEGLPTVMLEAMARGTPVIGTEHAGIPEVIIDGVNGYLVPERDVQLLSERITKILTDQNVGPRLAREGRLMVEQKFNLVKQAAKLEKLYESLIARSELSKFNDPVNSKCEIVAAKISD